MKTSEQLNELAEALASAQGEFQNPERNREVEVQTRTGGKYKFRYSTLDCVMDAARPVLSKHGLSIAQFPSTHDGRLTVTTRLMHKSGQWLENELGVPSSTANPQEIGSAITYLKRYSYCSLLGIASEEDDDGNAASGNHITGQKDRDRKPPPRQAEKQPPPPDAEPSLVAYISGCTNKDQLLNAIDRIKGEPITKRGEYTKLAWDRWKLMLGTDMGALEELLQIVTASPAKQSTKDQYTADIARLMTKAKAQETLDQAEELFGGEAA